MYSSSNCIIQNNVIISPILGINLEFCDNITIENNVIDNSQIGINLQFCDNIMIESNKVNNSYKGIDIIFSDNIKISYNKLTNGLLNSYGINIRDTDNSLINGNIIENIWYGILLESQNTLIEYNTFLKNKIGIYFYTLIIEQNGIGIPKGGYTIQKNNFIENQKDDIFFIYYYRFNKIEKSIFQNEKTTIENNYYKPHISIFPKAHQGKINIIFNGNWRSNEWYAIDWLPASEPFEIGED